MNQKLTQWQPTPFSPICDLSYCAIQHKITFMSRLLRVTHRTLINSLISRERTLSLMDCFGNHCYILKFWEEILTKSLKKFSSNTVQNNPPSLFSFILFRVGLNVRIPFHQHLHWGVYWTLSSKQVSCTSWSTVCSLPLIFPLTLIFFLSICARWVSGSVMSNISRLFLFLILTLNKWISRNIYMLIKLTKEWNVWHWHIFSVR